MKDHKEYYAQSKCLTAPKVNEIPLPNFNNDNDDSIGCNSSKISLNSNMEDFFKLWCKYNTPYNEAKEV